MGLLDGLMGNASVIEGEKLTKLIQELEPVLVAGEQIAVAYQLVRDLILLTDRRLLLIDKHGLTGSKVQYRSVPYKSITQFSIESAGSFDLEAELKVWVSGQAEPIQKQFNKRVNIYQMQQALAARVCK